MTNDRIWVSPYLAGLSCRCPRRGKGPLFDGFLRLGGDCSVCGLNYANADPGDGPAVFVIFIVGFLSVALAFIARFSWDWSIPMAFAISAIATIVLIGLLLRPLKATLIALQFRNKAEEVRATRASDVD
ncbi:MAG: DUF983 domain-containing protein [Pseudomonadota bacterium]